MTRYNTFQVAYKTGRKLVVAVIGFTVVLFGVVLLFTPGPAFVVIPIGLAILGLEFAWARRWLTYLKQHAQGVSEKYRQFRMKQNNRQE
jgi:tellurite resistance protein TerC